MTYTGTKFAKKTPPPYEGPVGLPSWNNQLCHILILGWLCAHTSYHGKW